MTTHPMRFETLLDSHHDEIYGYLWRMMNGGSEAEDLTQEVFLRAYQAFGRLRRGSNHRAWLYRIATNLAYTTLRKNQRQTERTVSPVEEGQAFASGGGPSPDRQVILNETMEAVRREIAGLPPKQQAAVVLRHVQGLEYAEIAQALNCSEDSARANVYQGLGRLRRVLADDWS
ncbi:RNA polymerase sigma factor [Chloroflexota bacterium]